MLVALVLTGALPCAAAAQTTLWLDGALSSARPPAGAPQTNTTSYGIAGVRGESLQQAWKLGAGLSGGHALESEGGRWLWAQADAQHKWVKTGVFWLDYREDFHYGTVGAQITPEVRFAGNALTLRPHATVARWRTEGFAQTYGVAGAALQYSRTFDAVLLRVTGEAYSSGDNGYASGGYYGLRAEGFTNWRETTIGAGVLLGRSPIDDEAGFTLWAARALGDRLRVEAQFARTVSEAVFGTPGSLGFTLGVSYRLMHREPVPPIPLAAVGEAVTKGRTVVFTVKVPHAKSVAVSGTFSDWRPIALKAKGEAWTGTVDVEPGTHQFGFLIDGTIWYVPPDARDVIDDGFGRKNVTLVVRPK